ncbi:MAG: UDP-N-acetylmuramoyl-tripeptide--D-alanyl-D-alanine ligase [Pseudomonadota bacterium]
MLSEWTVADILSASGGKLLCGSPAIHINGISIDSRTMVRDACFIAIKGDRYDGHDFIPGALNAGALAIIASDIPNQEVIKRENAIAYIKVADTKKALGQLALWRRDKAGIPVVAITGTNGKTTTKNMTQAVLNQYLSALATAGNQNNQIGVPLTLLRLEGFHKVAILEFGTNTPGEIKELSNIARPNVGVITNIGRGHLERLSTIDGIMKEKGDLFASLPQDGVAIVNMDDPRTRTLGASHHGQTITCGIENKSAHVTAKDIRSNGEGHFFMLSTPAGKIEVRLSLPGRFNISNALSAASVGHYFNVPLEMIRDGLEQIRPAALRMQLIRLNTGIMVINDTYNANPESMLSALETLFFLKGKGDGVAALGDMLELGDHANKAHYEIGETTVRYSLTHLFTVGRLADYIAQGAMNGGMQRERITSGMHEEVLELLKSSLKTGDWVLVKGSRGMAMERIVEGLIKAFGIENKA